MQEPGFPIHSTFRLIFHGPQYQMPLKDLQKLFQKRSLALFSQLYIAPNVELPYWKAY